MNINKLEYTVHERDKHPGQKFAYLILENWAGLMLLQVRSLAGFMWLLVTRRDGKFQCVGTLTSTQKDLNPAELILSKLGFGERLWRLVTLQPLHTVTEMFLPSFIVVLSRKELLLYKLMRNITVPVLQRIIQLDNRTRRLNAETIGRALTNVFNRYGDLGADFFPAEFEKEIAALIH